MSAPEAFDIGIVGAGPAGAWAARRLARAGARVGVFDDSHPREKPCGGGLTGRAVELITRELGRVPAPVVTVEAVRFERALPSPGHRAREEAGEAATVELSDAGPSGPASLVVAARAALDRGLLDAAVAAGATLVAERVVDVTCHVSGARIHTRRGAYRADLVLGADGANSLVRRRLASALSRRQISVGAGYFARGCTTREIAIRWVADPPGYLWSFPRPDHLAVGVCSPADRIVGAAGLQHRADGWMRADAVASRAVRLEPYCWPIPSLGADDFDALTVAGERWMLLGDAAGLVDPLTREGIFYALRSGELAAEAAAAARPAVRYREQLRAEVLPELQRAATLADGFFGAGFSALIVQALAASPAIRSVMVDLVGGRQPYIGLRRRLLATLELGLAWQVIREGWGWGWRRRTPGRSGTRLPPG